MHRFLLGFVLVVSLVECCTDLHPSDAAVLLAGGNPASCGVSCTCVQIADECRVRTVSADLWFDNSSAPLDVISLPELESIGGMLRVLGYSTSSVIFSKLASVNDLIIIEGNPNLMNISLPTLSFVGSKSISVAVNDALRSVSVPMYGGHLNASIQILSSNELVSLTVDMASLQSTQYLSLRGVQDVWFPSLVSIGSFISCVGSNVRTISFPVLRTLGGNTGISLVSLPNVTSISFPSLMTIEGDFRVLSNLKIEFIDFGSLAEIGGYYVGVYGNPALANVSLPSLTLIRGNPSFEVVVSSLFSVPLYQGNENASISISGVDELSESIVNMSSLQSAQYLALRDVPDVLFPSLVTIGSLLSCLGNNTRTISFPVLRTLGGNTGISLVSLPNVASISFPSLATIEGDFRVVSNLKLELLDFRSLAEIGGYFVAISGNSLLGNISLPALRLIKGLNPTFEIAINSALLSVSVPSFFGGDELSLQITSNPLLSSLNFSSLLTVGYLTVSGSSMDFTSLCRVNHDAIFGPTNAVVILCLDQICWQGLTNVGSVTAVFPIEGCICDCSGSSNSLPTTTTTTTTIPTTTTTTTTTARTTTTTTTATTTTTLPVTSVLTTATTTATTAPVCNTNLISNGSFEAGAFVNNAPNGNGAMTLPSGSTAVSGWITVNAESAWVTRPNSYVNRNPQDGNFYVDLSGFHDAVPYAGLMQEIPTEIGMSYAVRFYYQRDGSGQAVTVTVKDVVSGAIISSESFAGGSSWQQGSLSFLGTGSVVSLRLRGSAQDNIANIGIDNVILVRVCSSLFSTTSSETTSPTLYVPPTNSPVPTCGSLNLSSCAAGCPCGCSSAYVRNCDDLGVCSSCKRSTWGTLYCENTCACGCYQYEFANWCDRNNGTCLGCPKSRWGTGFCENLCPSGCYQYEFANWCDRDTSVCRGCKNGLWGVDTCNETCPCGCYQYQSVNICDRATGMCRSCQSGWSGPRCDIPTVSNPPAPYCGSGNFSSTSTTLTTSTFPSSTFPSTTIVSTTTPSPSCSPLNCNAGCCDQQGVCRDIAVQSDSLCGMAGDRCMDCGIQNGSCNSTFGSCSFRLGCCGTPDSVSCQAQECLPQPPPCTLSLRRNLPCIVTNSGVCSFVPPPTQFVTLIGRNETLYEVTLRIRGLMESASYGGGLAEGLCYRGGVPVNSSRNDFVLAVSQPLQILHLNNVESFQAVDYIVSVSIRGGAEMSLLISSQDRFQDVNAGSLVVPVLRPAPEAYNGQFVQVDVLLVKALEASCNLSCTSPLLPLLVHSAASYANIYEGVSSHPPYVLWTTSVGFCLDSEGLVLLQSSQSGVSRVFAQDTILIRLDSGPLRVYNFFNACGNSSVLATYGACTDWGTNGWGAAISLGVLAQGKHVVEVSFASAASVAVVQTSDLWIVRRESYYAGLAVVTPFLKEPTSYIGALANNLSDVRLAITFSSLITEDQAQQIVDLLIAQGYSVTITDVNVSKKRSAGSSVQLLVSGFNAGDVVNGIVQVLQNDPSYFTRSDNLLPLVTRMSASVDAQSQVSFTSPFALADCNFDGDVNLQDLVIVLSKWGNCSYAAGCIGDITGDFVVDLKDLVTVLNSWTR